MTNNESISKSIMGNSNVERAISTQSGSPRRHNGIVVRDSEYQLNHLKTKQQSNINTTRGSFSWSPCFQTSPSKDETVPARSVDQTGRELVTGDNNNHNSNRMKKGVFFDTVDIFFFNRAQGFSSIPSSGGSTLGMTRTHFLSERLSLEVFENARRQRRRERSVELSRTKSRRPRVSLSTIMSHHRHIPHSIAAKFNLPDSEVDNCSFLDLSDISEEELENENEIFVQPYNVKLRRYLLRESGVQKIDSKEQNDCKRIRISRGRSGCRCVGECIAEKCECSLLGVNCHVDRSSFPCNCIASGCQNPQGRTEFDLKRVRGHLRDILDKHKLRSNDDVECQIDKA